MTYGRSTYRELIDGIRFDVQEEEALAAIGVVDEAIVAEILRAESSLTKLVKAQEEYTLRLKTDDTEYLFQDRPAITGASNTSPITITCPSHGLSNYNRVTIRGIRGNTAGNGTWFLTGVAATTFIINPGAYVAGVEASTTATTITTETAHGFANGASITLQGTPVDGTHVITLVGATSFTVPVIPADDTYTAGSGIAYRLLASSANGTYVSGGRVWFDSELPTHIGDVLRGLRVLANTNYKRPIEACNLQNIVRLEQENFGIDYGTNWSGPSSMAIGRKDLGKYLKMYPSPKENADATIHGRLQIQAELYKLDPQDTEIHMPSEFDEMLKSMVVQKLFRLLKKFDEMKIAQAEFNRLYEQYIISKPDRDRLEVTYM